MIASCAFWAGAPWLGATGARPGGAGLAVTGAEIVWPAVVAAALLVVGLVALIWYRRRGRRKSH
ncbi:MAG: hypothetical protein FWD74_04785 [Actinomycetia bacterium]|nr:hypothetical protein [Actinomycetes bacterium]